MHEFDELDGLGPNIDAEKTFGVLAGSAWRRINLKAVDHGGGREG
jgi:hypothetical protein